MPTDEYQRERNRAKMAAYRARNVEKCRQQSREAVRRMRKRQKAANPVKPKPIVPKPPRPQPATKPTPPKKIDRIALLRERFMAFRKQKTNE